MIHTGSSIVVSCADLLLVYLWLHILLNV